MFSRDRGIIFFFFLLIVFFYALPSFGLNARFADLSVPKLSQIIVPDTIQTQKLSPTEYRLYFNKSTVFPIDILVSDIFGAHVHLYVKDPSEIKETKVESGIISDPTANQVALDHLPKLCPRLTIEDDKNGVKLFYETKKDLINEKPTLQLFDPDVKNSERQKTLLKNLDERNVLEVRQIKITYDFEDNTIVDYQGPHPLTGKPHLVYEGDGGFYANFHYAVVPYDERILSLNRQEALNLAQGKLDYIDRQDLTPEIRAHSFLPGPYLSKEKYYSMCEWGDTSFQAGEQTLYYRDLKIWDWDFLVKGRTGNKVLVIVWEGDEEDWLISDGLLDPYYLTDEVVGIFTVERDKSLEPLVLTNDQKNFMMVVQTVD